MNTYKLKNILKGSLKFNSLKFYYNKNLSNKYFCSSIERFNYNFYQDNSQLLNHNIIIDVEKNNEDIVSIELKGRNSKAPKRANHGARPCSSVMRRLKSRAYHKNIRIK
jgi:hypothetical protein